MRGWAPVGAALLFVCCALRVQAQSAGGIHLSPAFQEIMVRDNEASASGKLWLTNTTGAVQTYSLTAVSVEQFDSEGRVALNDRPLAGKDVKLADFLLFSDREIVLADQESRDVPFFIMNQPRLAPGGHYAAIIVRQEAAATGEQKILPAVASFVFVRKVGGEQYHLSLQAVPFLTQVWRFSVPRQFTATFSNQGNIHITPRGMLSLHDIMGREVYRGVLNESSTIVFPNTQRELVVRLFPTQRPWPIMLYRAHLRGYSDPGEVPFSQLGWVLVTDWRFGVMLGVVAGGTGWALGRKRGARS